MPTPTTLLANAFQEDPLFVHILPNPARRRRALRWMMGRNLALARQLGTIDTLDNAGIALWFPPRSAPFSPAALVRSGLIAAPLVFGPPATIRLWRAFAASGTNARDLTDDWYLYMLAVDPSARGRGLARTLIEKGVERAAATGAAVHLETNNGANLAFYEKVGFVVVGHEEPEHGPEEWLLRNATPR
ncbi:MAG: N-acetyltransferase [bacterium]|nr:N-acetyltransferase [bacterium]